MDMQPQTSLMGARADTYTPQRLNAPVQLNPYKMGNQTQLLQKTGMPIAQAVNKSAQNPNNTYAKGGIVPPPSPDQLSAQEAALKFKSSDIDTLSKALEDEPVMGGKKDKPQVEAKKSSDPTEEMFQQYSSPEGKKYLEDRSKMKGPHPTGEDDTKKFAKGGSVHSSLKNLSLKDIIKLLASHPELPGAKELGSSNPAMATGGSVRKEAKSHGMGLLNMNKDAGGYAKGGDVPVPTYTPKKPLEPVNMATGGEMDAGDITGYGPDGTPIVDNGDGSTGYGNINDLLGRPKNAPTLGTGATPVNGVSRNAANTAQPNKMAQGGAEGPPPGSLAKEVADDVPAKLSEGEFVFSADVVRYYGLRVLTAMMDHAREELMEMENEGNIRSPGDGKDNNTVSTGQGTLGQFMQDSKPNPDAYDQGSETGEGDDEISGLLKECMGGSVGMATGGGIGEEQSLAQGGEVDSSYGNDMDSGESELVTSQPVGGTSLDYAKGGIVTSASSSLTPKKLASNVPTAKMPLSKPQAIEVPKVKGAKPIHLPRFNQGGMAVKNMMPTQSIVG